jgi:Fe-S-cluster containining protein
MVTASDLELVAGRECGACNVCCVALTINDPALQKPQGYRCRNARPDNSCAIYETRPQTCRTFFCGWRYLKWIREPLRPDTSDVLFRLHYDKPDAAGQRQLGVMVTLLSNAALKAEGLAETVAAAIAAGLPVFIHVPGPPGHTASTAKLNDVLRDAVLTRNKPAVLEILRQARARGRKGDHKPIVLGRPTEGGAAEQE